MVRRKTFCLYFQVIYPKSDSQRKSLLEAVKGILLFKALDPGELKERRQ